MPATLDIVSPAVKENAANASLPTPSSPAPSAHSWKSFFRKGSNSTKKVPNRKAPLTVETAYNDDNHTLLSPSMPVAVEGSQVVLTPSSLSSFPLRYSSHTSDSLSSDGRIDGNLNPSGTPRDDQFRVPGQVAASSSSSSRYAEGPPSISKSKSSGSKSKQQRGLGVSTNRAMTANASQYSFTLPPTPNTSTSMSGTVSPGTSRNGSTLSPPKAKSVGASASRFIRRVASAPNAKGFFSGRRTSTNTRRAATQGLDDDPPPVPVVPPLPGQHSNPSSAQHYHHSQYGKSALKRSGASGSEKGTDSLDTMSSASSTHRHHQQSLRTPQRQRTYPAPLSTHTHGSIPSTPGRSPTVAVAPVSPLPKGKEWMNMPPSTSEIGSGTTQMLGPGKTPFRRTYSSNSIKVKSVSSTPLFAWIFGRFHSIWTFSDSLRLCVCSSFSLFHDFYPELSMLNFLFSVIG